ncbi:hypothetical protein C8F01DRAFT_924567, partial [Mycena amicta]
LALPQGTLTYESPVHKTWTTIDLVFTSADISDAVVTCDAVNDKRLPGADHLPIIANLDYSLIRVSESPRPNFRAVDWDTFTKAAKSYLDTHPIPLDILTTADYDRTYLALDAMLQSLVRMHVPKLATCPYSKRWWTHELSKLLANSRSANRTNF